MSRNTEDSTADIAGMEPLRIIYATKSNIYEQAPSNQSPACLRCRKQKLKCSKDRPICKRCSSLNTTCSYPLPTDRKKLAANRGSRSIPLDANTHTSRALDFALDPMARNDHSNEFMHVFQHDDRFDAPRLPVEVEQSISHESISPLSNTVESQPLRSEVHSPAAPTNEVAMFLIEVYFSRVYNAPLLFHKPTFLCDWSMNRIPEFMSLSIFALASIYLNTKQDQEMEYSGILPLAFDWQKLGMEWADLASQKVLAQADKPSLQTVQACQNLVLFWFSRAQTDRANFHANVAYRTCRLLGHHRNTEDEDVDLVTAELRRRCLWSCWMTQCISQENACFPNGSWTEIAGTLLPSDDESFTAGDPSPGEYLDEKGEVQNRGGFPKGRPRPSYAAEFAKLTGIWWEIQRSVRRFTNRSSQDTAQQLGSLFDLARNLERLHDDLPPELDFANAVNSTSRDNLERIFALSCLYHLCVVTLHASIVPVFLTSTQMQSSDIPRQIVQTSANEALSHSSRVLSMASTFLDHTPDVSKVPSITGFCMFACISIQHKYLCSSHKPRPLYQTFKSALSILNILKEYWHILQPLAEQLDRQVTYDLKTSAEQLPNFESTLTTRHSITEFPNRQRSGSFPDIITFIESEDSKVRKRSVASSSTPSTDIVQISSRDLITSPSANKSISSEQDPFQALRNRQRPQADTLMNDVSISQTDSRSSDQETWWKQGIVETQPDSYAIFHNPYMNLP